MTNAFADDLVARLQGLKPDGLYREEQVIASPQQGEVRIEGGAACINLCANNYLGACAAENSRATDPHEHPRIARDRVHCWDSAAEYGHHFRKSVSLSPPPAFGSVLRRTLLGLANHPRPVEAARDALAEYGFGMSSVRFICGTQLPHKRLEVRLSEFLGMEDAILYPSCFDANTGLFEALLGPEDAVVSDALNDASMIDGVRLCKAKRVHYANNDMAELETRLIEAPDARYRLIATDGAFSMDGCIADLPAICDLAERYDAMVIFDDRRAVGFVGASVRRTHVPRRAGRAAPWYRPDLCTPLAHAEELQVLRTKKCSSIAESQMPKE